MHLKEDAMKNGQLKPAYNLQYSVDAVGHRRSTTLRFDHADLFF